jgi:CDP-paratose 2-epimerase
MVDTKVVVLGGCGFIGSNIALHLKSYSYEVSVVDNFSRNGSLLNKKILEDSDVEVIEQSVENLTSSQIFDDHGTRTVIIDCAANPSVGAGYTDSISSLYTDNVMGLAHLLDISKGRNVHVIYLSSSRILPLNFLQSINLTIKNDRLTNLAK